MFRNLHTLDVSENALPFAKIGSIESLKKLNFSCNGLKSLDLEVEGRFTNLESLDLSYNNIDRAALIVLATLPNLKYLDLTSNKIKYIAPEIQDMEHWKDHVITLILPFQVAALGLHLNEPASTGREATQNDMQFSVTSEALAVVPPSSVPAEAVTSNQIPDQQSKHQLYDENKLYQVNSIGFQNLECLILEKNSLGTSDPHDIWNILAKLPRYVSSAHFFVKHSSLTNCIFKYQNSQSQNTQRKQMFHENHFTNDTPPISTIKCRRNPINQFSQKI